MHLYKIWFEFLPSLSNSVRYKDHWMIEISRLTYSQTKRQVDKPHGWRDMQLDRVNSYAFEAFVTDRSRSGTLHCADPKVWSGSRPW